MTPPASRRPSRLKRLWSVAGSKKWSGLSHFAVYNQYLTVLLATTQLWLGTYMLANLLSYGKWVEDCSGLYSFDPDRSNLQMRPPFSVRTESDQQHNIPSQEVGSFGDLGSKFGIVIYTVVLPLVSIMYAGSLVLQHLRGSYITLRTALAMACLQLLDLVWYFLYTRDDYEHRTLVVDWEPKGGEKLFDDWPVCFVTPGRGKQLLKERERRTNSLEARKCLAVVCGGLTLSYIFLTLLAIRHAAKASRVNQHTFAAAQRIRSRRRHSISHSHSNIPLHDIVTPAPTHVRVPTHTPQGEYPSTAVNTPLPLGQERVNEGYEGRAASERRSSTGSWSRVEDPFEDPADPFKEPTTSKDIV